MLKILLGAIAALLFTAQVSAQKSQSGAFVENHGGDSNCEIIVTAYLTYQSPGGPVSFPPITKVIPAQTTAFFTKPYNAQITTYQLINAQFVMQIGNTTYTNLGESWQIWNDGACDGVAPTIWRPKGSFRYVAGSDFITGKN